MDYLFICVISYLIGSVPFAFLIGKVFYNTDVRQKGSGNLGGSNTGRVLGAKAGVAVMTLDLLKAAVSVSLASGIRMESWALGCAGIWAAIGHCYPIYLRFRGGKAVAALYGFLLALWLVAGFSPWVFFLPLITFLVVLAVFKIVSLSSILSSLAAVICMWAMDVDPGILLAAVLFFLLILLRHSGNIQRMMTGTERKIRWMTISGKNQKNEQNPSV